jgi:DNA-binding CsgD family transcriptional regulator
MIDAIGQVVEEQAVKVMPLVRTKVPPEDVDDVMQDIRIAFWISLPGHRGEAALSTYAHSIAKRRIADYWRRAYKEKRVMKALIEENFPAWPSEPENGNGNGQGDWLRPAEKEVFRLLGRGLTNAEIAAALFRDVNTVRSHIKAIYGKLQCRNRVKVALLAHQIFTKEEA